MTIPDIAQRAHAPHKFPEAILLDPRRHGSVLSRRGKTRGYGMAQPPRAIRVGDIIRAIGGPLALIPCQPGLPAVAGLRHPAADVAGARRHRQKARRDQPGRAGRPWGGRARQWCRDGEGPSGARGREHRAGLPQRPF
ncbi:Rrf2 family transcriptional regulator [Roseomonas sp. SG15]|uniref:Rrf2 family transcriptional regulator n=1 Tax=Roseomonas indoligenes TaxID=2820811 RepID=A0A940S9L4_9PROT|nr:Rrf2 family transcriptional regulator [Pararoseomonas indoligenes]